MEKRMVIVPFDVEMAKKITNGKVEGRIVTRDGRSARVICWDKQGSLNPIVALIEKESEYELLETYKGNGMYYVRKDDNLDLMLEIPEYMTFKDGDVIAYDGFDTISITMADVIRNVNDVFAHYYAELRNGKLHFYEEVVRDVLNVGARFATEDEKQKLIDALKASKEPKAKEYLKRFFNIEVKPECEFKPFDKVLVRSFNQSPWVARFFDRMFEGDYACTDSLTYKQCIPYEGNEHLHDTTEDYKGD